MASLILKRKRLEKLRQLRGKRVTVLDVNFKLF